MNISLSDHVEQKQSLVAIIPDLYGEGMHTRLSNPNLDRMAWTIAQSGINSVPTSALRELGFESRRIGVHPEIAHTLVDDAVPLVVRQRAFGYIAAKLAAARSHTTDAPSRAA
jgi:hypothetical protein